jgi:hypothetical protein
MLKIMYWRKGRRSKRMGGEKVKMRLVLMNIFEEVGNNAGTRVCSPMCPLFFECKIPRGVVRKAEY